MNISIIGGDLRLVNLAIMFADDNNKVIVYGMEESREITIDKRIVKVQNLKDAICESEIVIGAIPLLKENGEIYSDFSNKHININELTTEKYKNKVFISGNIPSNIKEDLDKNYKKVIDMMKQEKLVILNTIATAEGAINIAIQHTDSILHGSKILILGFGRVGKVVARKFKGLCCNVTCAARKSTDLAWIKTLGYKAIDIKDIKEDLKKYDIIINTIPEIIIEKDEIECMKDKVLVIDLASSPGGINREEARKLNLNYIWALALPGKIAPLSSAKFIKESIYDLLSKN